MTRRRRTRRGNNVLTTTLTGLAIGLALFAFTLPAKAQQAEQPDKYLILATSRTGSMEEELNAVGARGYRVAGAQGGETAFDGNEAVVIMALDPEGRQFRYILLATSRTGDDAGRAQRGSTGIRAGRHDRVSVDVWRRRGGRYSRSRDRGRMTARLCRGVGARLFPPPG